MICVITGKDEHQDAVRKHPILDFVGNRVFERFSLQTNIAADSMMVSAGDFEKSKMIADLLREFAGGALARGLQYKMFRELGSVIGLHGDRTLRLDLIAAKLAESGMHAAVVQLADNPYEFRYAAFCSKHKGTIDRVVVRAKEMGLACTEHRPPEKLPEDQASEKDTSDEHTG